MSGFPTKSRTYNPELTNVDLLVPSTLIFPTIAEFSVIESPEILKMLSGQTLKHCVLSCA